MLIVMVDDSVLTVGNEAKVRSRNLMFGTKLFGDVFMAPMTLKVFCIA